MKALEKAARIIDETVFELPNVYPYTIRREEAFAKARAVISSIEVDDAMVEAFAEVGADARRAVREKNYADCRPFPDAIAEVQWVPAALKAFLHSILVDGEGR